MVIGRDTFLTPGDVEQMRWVPELVFINCCHLGSMRGSDKGALAANLGMQFIRMGVRAVVAAGWAVDDAAALAFANTFYRLMLAGETFGEAVRAAREEVWLRYRGVNTWGAYQCYGDPSYTLLRGRPAPRPQARRFHCPTELGVELDNLTQALRSSGGAEGRPSTARMEVRSRSSAACTGQPPRRAMTARAAASRSGKIMSAVARRGWTGTVARVTALTKPSVPSEPIMRWVKISSGSSNSVRALMA